MAKRLFRACRNMRYKSGNVPAGTLVWFDKPQEWVDRMLGFEIIAIVRTPPFEALPGWEERGPIIEMAGIETVEDFLRRDPLELAELLEESVENMTYWKRDLMMWLSGQAPGP